MRAINLRLMCSDKACQFSKLNRDASIGHYNIMRKIKPFYPIRGHERL